MTPLETLFRLEIEFHRRLHTVAPGLIDAGSLHTSTPAPGKNCPGSALRWAILAGYAKLEAT
jgi:hypothetical protein